MKEVMVSVLGHFGYGKELLNGQTVKTKILAQAMKAQLGEENIRCIDTHGGVKVLLKAPFQVLEAVRGSENVVILPAHNGLRVYAPLLSLARKCGGKCKLHYVVIGGWLPEFLKERRVLKKQLQSFDGIYVETQTMKWALEEQGFSNVLVMPNCKELPILLPEEVVYDHQEPYKLCTFSRVMKEKGIEDAVEAVKAVNEHFGRRVCTLDIYGQIDPGQIQWFEALKKTFPECIRYGGLVPFDKSVGVLKDYYALLFPTRFYTEGIPGTIIDAYAAGVPVIAARWENYEDVIDDGVGGYGFAFESQADFKERLIFACQHPEQWDALRPRCLEEARKYCPEEVIKRITDRF